MGDPKIFCKSLVQIFTGIIKLVISANNGDGTVGIGEIQYFTNPNSQAGKYGNAIDLKDDYIDLPFKADQGSTMA